MSTEQQLTDFNYSIGKFVTAPGIEIGILAGLMDDTNTYIMLSEGYVLRRPLAWCRYVTPPEDPHCDIPLHSTVVVAGGRLQGMLGTVVGTLEGRAFMRALNGSNPFDPAEIYHIEAVVFVEDANWLTQWQAPYEHQRLFRNGYFLPPRTR